MIFFPTHCPICNKKINYLDVGKGWRGNCKDDNHKLTIYYYTKEFEDDTNESCIYLRFENPVIHSCKITEKAFNINLRDDFILSDSPVTNQKEFQSAIDNAIDSQLFQ